jgi:adenosylcobinamide-phosphate synthase
MALMACATGPAAWAALPLALTLAWAGDRCLGEPPAAWHPVVWIGRVLGPLGAGLKRLPPAWAFATGALAWCGCACALFAAAWAAQVFLLNRLGLYAAPVLALLLKPMFAWRMLHDEVHSVERSFEAGGAGGGLPQARRQLARLVSRDVGLLGEAEVREAAIETLAENLNDSVVAPLFWFALFGLPGAVAYRFANTADAMWGYRGEWEWAGKFAARADDALSWLPARLTALLLLLSSFPSGTIATSVRKNSTPTPVRADPSTGSGVNARLRLVEAGACLGDDTSESSMRTGGDGSRNRETLAGRCWRDLLRLWPMARLTPSPNGGWPMGAMALRLGVRLGKPGVYLLNANGSAPTAAHLRQALGHARQAAGWSAALAAVASAGGAWVCLAGG